MRNIKMILAYEGTQYAGFQRQVNGPTIQGIVEAKLSQILNHPVSIIGAGRTDAGVHARGQVINFRTANLLPVAKIHKALNSLLPEDILVLDAVETDQEFHARYSAKNKTYSYSIDNGPLRPLFNRNFVYHYPHRLDLSKIREAIDFLVGTHDFKSFQAVGTNIDNTVRKVNFCHLEGSDSLIKLVINADGFLYHMVRNIVGTLLIVGNGKMTVENFREIMEKRDRSLAGPTAPAQGLCLEAVFY